MELAEPISWINEQLLATFGREEFAGGNPKFRVVFSNDQYEKRLMHCTNEGFALIHPEVREVPKYSLYIRDRYILERIVPVVNETDLVDKVSYEPAWTFQDDKGNYLPPRLDACVFICEALFAASGKANTHVKYKDPAVEPEHRKQLVDKMMAELFGNETSTGDSLAYKEGIVNPATAEHFKEAQPTSGGYLSPEQIGS